jgi:hypothetical protein
MSHWRQLAKEAGAAIRAKRSLVNHVPRQEAARP